MGVMGGIGVIGVKEATGAMCHGSHGSHRIHRSHATSARCSTITNTTVYRSHQYYGTTTVLLRYYYGTTTVRRRYDDGMTKAHLEACAVELALRRPSRLAQHAAALASPRQVFKWRRRGARHTPPQAVEPLGGTSRKQRKDQPACDQYVDGVVQLAILRREALLLQIVARSWPDRNQIVARSWPGDAP